MDFTQSQLRIMSAEDKEDIKRATEEGFRMPGYTRLQQSPLGNGIQAVKQLFSPAALRIVSHGKRYPESATPENCAKLLTIWNAAGSGHYEML